MVPANRAVASGWMEVRVVVIVAEQRRSMIEGILTCVIDTGGHSHDQSGRKESTGLINDNVQQNNRRGVVVAQHYSILKILPHSPPSNHLLQPYWLTP